MSLIIKAGILILNIIYSVIKLFPQRKKITIISRQGNAPSTDIRMIRDKMTELHPEYTVIVLCKKLEENLFQKMRYVSHMFTQMYHMATSEAVILDSYCIAASTLKHKKGLLIVQMWHSIGTMKKFGYSILDKEEGSSSKIAHLMKMHANYDYILVAGDGYREHLADGFRYPPEKIVTLPLPRVELLKSDEYKKDISDKIFTSYPELKNKKNVLYVPTFRKKSDDEFVSALTGLCAAFDYDNYNLIIKPHPLTDLDSFDNDSALIDREYSSFDMLFVSDIVISDYSCIMYEAAVLKKPIYLYTYDYDEYMRTRDIYMDYHKEVPGPICNTASSLICAIENNDYDFNKLDEFLNKYVFMRSQHETKDIIDFIFDHKKTRC